MMASLLNQIRPLGGLLLYGRWLALLTLLLCGGAQAVTQGDINASDARLKQLRNQQSELENNITTLEGRVWSLDRQILDTRKSLRAERTVERKQFHEAKRDYKRQSFAIEGIEKDIALVDFDIDIVERDMERDQQRHAALNMLKQRLAQSDYEARQAEYRRQLATLAQRKQPLQQELAAARDKLAQLEAQLASQKEDVDESALNADPKLAGLLQQRDAAARELTQARQQLAATAGRLNRETDRFNRLVSSFKREQSSRQQDLQTTAPVGTSPAANVAAAQTFKPEVGDYPSYVFVISGDQEPDIENTLHLKSWVESYGAKYIQARWNGFGDGDNAGEGGFKQAFKAYIRAIPKDAKLLLIGHGLGGGAAIEAATEIAYAENRTVDFLGVLDPMGDAGLRANIVYRTKGTCIRPDPENTMTNAEYIECIKSSQKRLITANIKYFYNRWQKDAGGPLDFQRQIPSIDANGNVVRVPTASGRFAIENGTEADQRRVYFAGAENAHQLLLAEEAKVLPKLLVRHLR